MKLFTPTCEKIRRSGRVPAPGQAVLHPGESRRGAALVMVLLLVTVVAGLATDLQNSTSVNLQLATNARDKLQAQLHARSAVQLEVFFLRFQSQIDNVVGQFLPIPLADLSSYFVSSDTMKGLLKREDATPEDKAVKDSYAEDAPFGDFQGSFWIEEVSDENRKINIGGKGWNVLSTQAFPLHMLLGGLIDDKRYDPLFETIGETRDPLRNRIEVIANITDWIDTNDYVDRVFAFTGDASIGGATEETRYERLPYGARYEPKNGQMRSLAELRLVTGINDAFMRLFGPNFTVWTDDIKVSMDEAGPEMLRAVVAAATISKLQYPGDDVKFQKFLTDRELMRIMPPPANKLSEPIFRTLVEGAGLRIDPNVWQLLTSQVITFDKRTPVYRITAVGRVGDTTSTMTVVWRDNSRGQSQGEIFYWRED